MAVHPLLKRRGAGRSFALAALAAVLLASCARKEAAPELRYGTPAEAGMDGAVLEEALGLYRNAVAEDQTRGAVLLVARRGIVVANEPIGWRDREAGLEMGRDTLFRMASNTKPVVATAVLQLYEQGRIDLQAPVSAHLPAFAEGASGKITPHQLLSHTSGLRINTIFLSPLLESSPEHLDAPSLQSEVSRFAAIGPEVEPGTSYSYSNPGFNTLGALVEVVSGQPLETYLREHVYLPLGMTESLNHESRADHDRMCKVYRRRGEEWRVGWKPGDDPDYPFVRASGGMISTTWDYALFCQAWLNGGTHAGTRILSPETVRVATMPQTKSVYPVSEQVERAEYYGYGWTVNVDGSYSHGGSDGTWAMVDRPRELIVLVFTQSPGSEGPRREFVQRVRSAIADLAVH